MSFQRQEVNAGLYTINFEMRDEYLYAYVEGKEDSLEISISYWSKVLEKCREHNYNKVLIEENLTENASSSEIYELAKEVAGMGFGNTLIAFVDRQLEHQELNKFGELVATNRGLRVKVFNSVREAEKWLLLH